MSPRSFDFSNVFYSVLGECINKFVPTRSSKGSKNKPQSHIKYPAFVKRLLRRKQAVWRRLKTFRTVKLKAEFRAISARCREAIHKSVRQFEESIIDSGNLGRFFRYANSKLVGKKNVGPLQRPDGSVTVDPEVKAKLLSDFFQTLFTHDKGSVPDAANLPTASPSGLSHIIFTPNLVRRIINKLKQKSAGGPDGIPPIFLKKCCIELCSPLAFLFQLFFDSSFLPTVWLQAFITPVFKKGDPTKPCNYRPISLTCSVCKVMECIIKDQLVAYLSAKGLISKQQHAFLAKRSTVTNVLESVRDWHLSFKNRLNVDCIYIDFAHAFDSITRSKMTEKLINFGVCGLLLCWIIAFLSNRFQCVILESCFSEWLPVVSGVPQGSVLGPILFILFVDDVGAIFSGDLNHQLFADDLKLYSSVESDADASALQSALDSLEQWCITWQLEVNVSKCHVLHFGKDSLQRQYHFAGSVIPSSNEVSDLGVTVDPLLSFDSHINNIIRKAYSRVGVLYKGFRSRSPALLVKAFVTYVRPLLEYASNVWSPYLLKHIRGIENVQRRFTKRIFSISHLSYSERLAVLGLDTLELRRLRSDLTLYYKIFHGLTHLPRDHLPADMPPNNTRSGGNRLATPGFSTLSIDNDFFIRCVACWNFLPSRIVDCQSVTVFKNSLYSVNLSTFLHAA